MFLLSEQLFFLISDMVKIETGSRIPIWRVFFQTGNVISQLCIVDLA